MTSTATHNSGAWQYCDPTVGQYSYVPTLSAGIIFSVFFGLATCFFTYYTIRKRLWYLSVVLGAAFETLGWIARAAANEYVCSPALFSMQISCTILAPAFFSAALYIILGILLARAPDLSPTLTPKGYLWIFCGADLLSLLLQAIGGGIAASSKTDTALTNGTHIMIAGIFLQLAFMTGFSVLFVQYVYLAYKSKPKVTLTSESLKSPCSAPS